MIPISTDAPIYHLPIATVSTIILNVICFVAFCMNIDSQEVALVTPDGRVIATEEQFADELSKFETEEEAEAFIESLTARASGWVQSLSVEFGTLKPWQWVTNNFMHAGWGHLIGNMIFLWAFGLIVEGKVGPFLFALIYLGIGAAYGCVLQICSLFIPWEGIALGASAAIFGLLALCIAWAPANEFTVLLRFSTFDISILMYGGFFLAKEVGFWALGGFTMSSELLHIIGFAVALPVGLWMVTSGHVDCEGWDLFSYWSGNTGNQSTVGKTKAQARQRATAQKQKAKDAEQLAREATARVEAARRLQDQVGQAIDQGNVELAIKLQNRLSLSNPATTWKQPDLYRIVQALLKAKDYQQALPLLETHIDLFEQSRFAMQVAMMKIWLSQRQPKKTLEYLRGFNLSFLSPEQIPQIKQLAAAAKKQLAAGVDDAASAL
jgi:membrane associated rhomboid family serine protease